MKKKKYFNLILIFLFLFTLSNSVSASGGTIYFNAQHDVPIDKSWTIRFNHVVTLGGTNVDNNVKEVVIEKINNLDPNGPEIPITIQIEHERIIISPVNYYDYGAEYVVKISLSNGKNYLMPFYVVNKPTPDNNIYGELDGNTNGNRANKGLVAESKGLVSQHDPLNTEKTGWIYYANPDDNMTLYKVRTDGTGKLKLSYDQANNINVINGWIFYYDLKGNLKKVKTDGTLTKTLISNVSVNSYIVIDDKADWIYYRKYIKSSTPYYEIHRIRRNDLRTNGYDDQTIVGGLTDDDETNDSVNAFYLKDNHLYYTTQDESQIRKINLDDVNIKNGINQNQAYDIVLDAPSKSMQLVGRYIYVINPNDEFIYKIPYWYNNFTYDGLAPINNNWVESTSHESTLHVTEDGWIYFTKQKDRGLYRIDKYGKNEELLITSPARNVNIINDWIYYRDPSNGNYYKIRTDGKYHQEWN